MAKWKDQTATDRQTADPYSGCDPGARIKIHHDAHRPNARMKSSPCCGAERPTILPLAGDQQRVAMHMVSSETLFWETMEKLKALGASSILVLPIEKMME